MDTDPNGGFRKLTHLLQSPPFPPVTFANLLLLYCKPQRGLYDLAADVMAENPDLLAKLPQARAPNGVRAAWLPAGPAHVLAWNPDLPAKLPPVSHEHLFLSVPLSGNPSWC